MTILQVLSIAFSFTGQTMPDLALAEMAKELSVYPEADVIAALKRCRSELKFIKFSDILDRLPSQHPGVEEAWALVSKTMNNEQISIVWTDQMRKGFGAALAVQDDKVAARMAFKEVYSQALSEARANHDFPKWSVSLGYDPIMREECVKQAAQKNLICQAHAAKLLAYDPPTVEATKLLEKL